MPLLRTLVVALVLVTSVASPLRAQTSTAGTADGPSRLVARLQALAQTGAPADLDSLVAASVPPTALADFSLDFFVPGVTRAAARELDRAPLPDVPDGDGFSLIVEIFSEVGTRARVMSARVDVRRFDATTEPWKIVDIERLTVVEGLYQLRVDATKGYSAKGLTIDSEDFRISMQDGTAFLVESDGGVTGLVLVGRGEFRFIPPSTTEQGQLRIFAGNPSMVGAIDGAFVRFSPSEYLTRVNTDVLTPVPVDRRLARRAQDLFEKERPKSYSIDMSEVSEEPWFLLPPAGDFLSELRTRRFGTLTYTKAGNQAEDISLFSRERRRTMSIYASKDKLAERGASYNEDDLAEFDITNYEINTEFDPDQETLTGRARLTIVSRSPVLSTLTLRLAESLAVSSVTSPQLGRLLFFRVRNQNGIFVNLPRVLGEGESFIISLAYSGTIASQRVDSENIAAQVGDEAPLVPPEPSWLFSNRAYWYPQNGASDYATARLRLTVPDGYGVVASGRPVSQTDLDLRDLVVTSTHGRTQVFTVPEPARYLAFVVARFQRVFDATIGTREGVSPRPPASAPSRDKLALSVAASPRQAATGRAAGLVAEDVMRFYGTLMGDTPYSSMSLALVEHESPGGHSPAYAVVLNAAPPTTQFLWRNDPASFLGFPEFFIAHELAHQWWGQAVGWNSYHEQWLSEGFAQYFAALYAQKSHGDGVFTDMLRQFRRWAVAESDQGPVYLGYRLGHVKNDSKVFRALVYNKGAIVLHMLRRLVGDEVFFRALRRFYTDYKFLKAGTPDLQRAFETESGRPLSRFFERWIYNAEIPHVRYKATVGSGEVVLRFEQDEAMAFDIPVLVTITTADGRVTDLVVPIADASTERRISVAGTVRSVQVNRDNGALAEFDGL